MQIVIYIPKSEIPKNQDIIEIPLHFIDGEVCEAGGYEFDVLPKGHGDLIDAGELLKQSYCIDDSATLSTRDVVNKEEIDNAVPIIKADKMIESEDKEWNIIDQYENRLKADMVAMLEDLELQIDEAAAYNLEVAKVQRLIRDRIDKLKKGK